MYLNFSGEGRKKWLKHSRFVKYPLLNNKSSVSSVSVVFNYVQMSLLQNIFSIEPTPKHLLESSQGCCWLEKNLTQLWKSPEKLFISKQNERRTSNEVLTKVAWLFLALLPHRSASQKRTLTHPVCLHSHSHTAHYSCSEHTRASNLINVFCLCTKIITKSKWQKAVKKYPKGKIKAQTSCFLSVMVPNAAVRLFSDKQHSFSRGSIHQLKRKIICPTHTKGWNS